MQLCRAKLHTLLLKNVKQGFSFKKTIFTMWHGPTCGITNALGWMHLLQKSTSCVNQLSHEHDSLLGITSFHNNKIIATFTTCDKISILHNFYIHQCNHHFGHNTY